MGPLKRMTVAAGWCDGPSLGRKTRQGGPFERCTFRASRGRRIRFSTASDQSPMQRMRGRRLGRYWAPQRRAMIESGQTAETDNFQSIRTIAGFHFLLAGRPPRWPP
jgi:hypothetical protein